MDSPACSVHPARGRKAAAGKYLRARRVLRAPCPRWGRKAPFSVHSPAGQASAWRGPGSAGRARAAPPHGDGSSTGTAPMCCPARSLPCCRTQSWPRSATKASDAGDPVRGGSRWVAARDRGGSKGSPGAVPDGRDGCLPGQPPAVREQDAGRCELDRAGGGAVPPVMYTSIRRTSPGS